MDARVIRVSRGPSKPKRKQQHARPGPTPTGPERAAQPAPPRLRDCPSPVRLVLCCLCASAPRPHRCCTDLPGSGDTPRSQAGTASLQNRGLSPRSLRGAARSRAHSRSLPGPLAKARSGRPAAPQPWAYPPQTVSSRASRFSWLRPWLPGGPPRCPPRSAGPTGPTSGSA